MSRVAVARQKVANWISPSRAKPISFAPEIITPFLGQGIGTHQPEHETLLRENVGVADICTRAIANRVATLVPLVKTSRRQSDGTLIDEILDDHVLKALLDRPHVNFTKQQLFRLSAQYIVTTGEAYWLKIANGLRLPGSLQPMPSQSVFPIVRDGVIEQYDVRDGSGEILRLDAADVIRFWFPDPETLYTSEGYLGPNAVNTDAYRFASEHLRSHFQHDATPSIMFKGTADAAAPGNDQWDRYQEDFVKKYSRRDGSHRGVPALVPPGWEPVFAALQTGSDITPLLEHWQMNQLMNFAVPSSILGRVVSGDRSSAEVNQWVFDKYAVLPIATMIADGLTSQLAGDFDDSLFVEFEPFVSDDKAFNLMQEKQDLELKVRSGQQVIEDRGGDPERASWAEFPVGTFSDQPYTGESGEDPFEVTPDDPEAFDGPDDEPDMDDESPSVDDDDERTRSAGFFIRAGFSKKEIELRVLARERRFRPKMERALRSIFETQRREAQKILKAGGRSLGVDGTIHSRAPVDISALFDPEGWGDLFDVKALTVLEQSYRFVAIEELSLLGIASSFEFTPTMAADLRIMGADLINFTNATTKARLSSKINAALATGVEEGEPTRVIAKAINEVFSGRKRNAMTIARTELHRSSINATLETFKIADVPWKQWIDQRDNRVRDAHQQSRIAPAQRGQPFFVEGLPAMGPGDRSLPPHLSINCRCDIQPLYVDPLGIEVA